MTDRTSVVPHGALWIAWFLIGALCACSTVTESPYDRHGTDPTTGDRQPSSPKLSYTRLTAPIDGSGRHELALLSQFDHLPAATLRQAYILAETGNASGALSRLNRLLYGNESVSPAVESYARFVRAHALRKLGRHDQAATEGRRAYDLAIDETLRRVLRPKLATPAARASYSAAMPDALARSVWKASPARRSNILPMGRVTRLTVHHSALLTHSMAKHDTIRAIQSIQRNHQGPEKRWADIGYHFLIDPAGRVWRGRSIQHQGAHAGDPRKNRGNIGICVLGNFVPAGQRPSRIQTQTLENLIAGLCARYAIPAEQILTHSHFKTTDCPGPYLTNTVRRMRVRVAASVSSED